MIGVAANVFVVVFVVFSFVAALSKSRKELLRRERRRLVYRAAIRLARS